MTDRDLLSLGRLLEAIHGHYYLRISAEQAVLLATFMRESWARRLGYDPDLALAVGRLTPLTPREGEPLLPRASVCSGRRCRGREGFPGSAGGQRRTRMRGELPTGPSMRRPAR